MTKQKNTKSDCGWAKLVLVSEPPEDLVEEAVEFIIRRELVCFAQNLEFARDMWRQVRGLVEAPEFPAHLREILVEWDGVRDVDGSCEIDGLNAALNPNYLADVRPRAAQLARGWMSQRKFTLKENRQ